MRVAIPTDFSENALNAVRYGLKLFQDRPCTFVLVHTYTPSFLRAEYLIHSPGQIGLGDFYQERAEKKLRGFFKKVKSMAHPEHHNWVLHTAFNTLVDELQQMTQKEKLDLILMGTQGASGMKEVLFGTNAVHVLSRATIPVMVVPGEADFTLGKEVLFPTDFQKNSASSDKQLLKVFLPMFGKLNILHIHDRSELEAASKSLRDSFMRSLGEFTTELMELTEQDVASAIEAYLNKNQPGLVVMVRNRHNFLENLVASSALKQIGFHTEVPLLVLPPA